MLLYLYYKDLPLRDAWNEVSKLRPIVRPNPGFLKELLEFELTLRNKSSMKYTDIYKEGMKLLPSSYSSIDVNLNLDSIK